MHSTSDPIATEIVTPTEAQTARPTRRKFLRRLLGTGAVLGAGALYATQVEPFWLDCHEVDAPIANLPAAFEGYRIAQLTDLHAGESVPISFLARAIDRVNAMNPDCVVVTGDLVTHDPDSVDPIVQVLARLRSPVYVTFGNHDYNPVGGVPGPVTVLADELEVKLSAIGCVVLRNRSVALNRNGQRLWLVGLEDLLTTRFLPDLAFFGVPRDEPRICLSHNPDGTNALRASSTRSHPQRPHARRAGAHPILGRDHAPDRRSSSRSGPIPTAAWAVVCEQGGWVSGPRQIRLSARDSGVSIEPRDGLNLNRRCRGTPRLPHAPVCGFEVAGVSRAVEQWRGH